MTEQTQLPLRLNAKKFSAFAPRLKRVCAGGLVQLDASEVTHSGALVTQMIIAAARTQHVQGVTPEISEISDRANSQLAMMGFTPEQLSEGVP